MPIEKIKKHRHKWQQCACNCPYCQCGGQYVECECGETRQIKRTKTGKIKLVK